MKKINENCPKIPVSSEDMKKCKKWYKPLLTLVIVAIFGLFCFGSSPKVGAATNYTENVRYKITVLDEPVELVDFSTPDLRISENTTNAVYDFDYRDLTGVEQWYYVIFQKDPGETYCSIYYSVKNFVDMNDYATAEIYDSSTNTWQNSLIPLEVDETQYISKDLYDRFIYTVFYNEIENFEIMYYITGWYTFNRTLTNDSIDGYRQLKLGGDLRFVYEVEDGVFPSFYSIMVGGGIYNINLKDSTGRTLTNITLIQDGAVKEEFRVLLFNSQYVDANTYEWLTDNGEFRYIPQLDKEYSASDLLFTFADIPFNYLSRFLNISLFNTTIFAIFCTMITIALGIYVVKVFK